MSQTVSSVVTKYLLDVQPGLALVLAETADGNTTRFVHGPRGLERQQNPNGGWMFPVRNGLDSVRAMSTAVVNYCFVESQTFMLQLVALRRKIAYACPGGCGR